MKTLIITLFLTIGLAGFVNGQTAPEKNGTAKDRLKAWLHIDQTVKPRSQMNHFESQKTDKRKVRHNGTIAHRQMHQRTKSKGVVVDGNGFSVPKLTKVNGKNKTSKTSINKRKKLHKKKNKNFDTYVMK